jgi:hypothetical protein
MRGVRVDLGWFLTFPKRESKANDQKLKEWPQPCDTTDFCNRIGRKADIRGRAASASSVAIDP